MLASQNAFLPSGGSKKVCGPVVEGIKKRSQRRMRFGGGTASHDPEKENAGWWDHDGGYPSPQEE